MLGVIDGTIDSKEIKGSEEVASKDENKPFSLESMSSEDQKLYSELLKAENDLSTDNFQTLKYELSESMKRGQTYRKQYTWDVKKWIKSQIGEHSRKNEQGYEKSIELQTCNTQVYCQ